MEPDHIPEVAMLQLACFPPPFPEELLWNGSHLRRHLEIFPEGQFVTLDQKDKVWASCSNTLVPDAVWDAHTSWTETVGGPYLRRFDRSGKTLYGLDVSVHPSVRGKGLLREFMKQRFDLCRGMNLTRYGTAVRMPGFASWANQTGDATPEMYARQVESGAVKDPTLTPMLRVGLRLEGVIRDYMDDFESGNAAAALEWMDR